MEFKKLSDVESVETVSDNANILIEENGVIKKASKTEVGGNHGVDMIICLNNLYNKDFSIVHGNASEIIAKLDNREVVCVVLTGEMNLGSIYVSTLCCQAHDVHVVHQNGELLYASFIIHDNYAGRAGQVLYVTLTINGENVVLDASHVYINIGDI